MEPVSQPPATWLALSQADDAAVLMLTPRGLGLGCDRLIGGPSGPAYRCIDLSRLDHPVDIHWSGPDSGSISDGADCIVFQGVEQIVLPACMHPDAGAEIIEFTGL